MFQEHIGKRSAKVKNSVERGAVRKFAEAIGDPHPIYISEEFGKMSRYRNNIAPPTFPRVFDYGEIVDLNLPTAGLIHGEQTYHYERPLYVDESIYCYSELSDYYDKKGSNGVMEFLVINSYGEDLQGNTIFTSKQTVIITESVRKGMTV